VRHTSIILRIQFSKKDSNMDWNTISRKARTSVDNLRRTYRHENIHDSRETALGRSKQAMTEERKQVGVKVTRLPVRKKLGG
jgi:hypothetical protein